MPIDQHASRRQPPAERIVIESGARRIAVRLPRYGVPIVSCLLALLGAWSVGSGAYVLFHDTVVAELRRGAQASSRGYEAQISTLRDELERTRTRRLVERTGVDERLAELDRRQETLEKRQTRLAEIASPIEASAGAAYDPALAYSAKPVPLDQPGAALDAVDAEDGAPAVSADRSEKLSTSLDAMEAKQVRVLEGLAAKAGDRRRKLESVYDAVRAPKPGVGDGRSRGGPFEPIPRRAMTFDGRADQVEAEMTAVEALDHGLNRIPLRTPAPGASITSGFGVRTDPFLGRAAFHSGLDFEEPYGEVVRATAAGRVSIAGWTGGYGNMVEIDHGGGLATRFGHMSAIAVVPGQEVKIGSALGRVGSTGRSTGPHLHYETRINGEAVDPIRFLNAGRMLVSGG
ncbi:MAG: peptidoglycan DD-metalloendopeptidase family protein [Hansschlegelia sp.]